MYDFFENPKNKKINLCDKEKKPTFAPALVPNDESIVR
jgi:hypothetical protein